MNERSADLTSAPPAVRPTADSKRLAIPYLHDGVDRDYIPDFILSLAIPGATARKEQLQVVLDTKGVLTSSGTSSEGPPSAGVEP